ncbi:MAG: prepilin-type N-terminal cleavage/methylation domain-containing protein [Deltaproteobacteria bacterium]|nr:prepilin-type N-terminal cleavage/methylation domain-containing protein [Deltaproteobacteria bacterium]
MRNRTSTTLARQGGFTLLEVLAAVALLGIVFTALARSASVGVLSEGDSRRRLEASLVADLQLAELELAALSGETPELGVTETELDDLSIVIETQPWSLPEWLQDESGASDSTVSSVLGDGTEGNPGAIREIRLSVTWFDGVNERSVERVTYTVDYGSVSGAGLPGGASLSDMERTLQDILDASEER